MKIAFCDDEVMNFRDFQHSVELYNKKNSAGAEVTYFPEGSQLREGLDKGSRYDVYFLDIVMPDPNGYQLAESIRKLGIEAPIIFISQYDIYDKKRESLKIFRFISKPINSRELFSCLDHINREAENKLKTISVRYRPAKGEDFTKTVIPLSEITHAMYYYHQITLFTEHNAYVFSSRESFKEYLENDLDNSLIQCSQSEAVNPDHILKYTKSRIFMKDGHSILITRSFRQTAFSKIQLYFSGDY